MKLREIFLALVGFNYTFVTGLSSVYFDPYKRTLSKPKWLQVLIFLSNIIILIGMPMMLIESLEKKIAERGQGNISNYLTLASTVIQPVVAFGTIATRLVRERLMMAIINDLIDLESSYFDKMPRQIKDSCKERARQLNTAFTAKCVCMVAFTVVFMVFNQFKASESTTWPNPLYVFLIGYKTNITLGATFHSFAVVCHINQRWLYTNAAIKDGLGRRMQHDELFPLFMVQMRLKDVVKRLCDAYKYSLFALRVLYLINSITCGYWLVYDISVWDYVSLSSDMGRVMIIGTIMYAFYIGDMYLADCIAENLTDARDETNEICRYYATCSRMSSATERVCEWFALHSCWSNFGLSFFNVYRINSQQTFAMMSFIFLYTIFIVQSDYKRMGKGELK